MRDGVWCLGSDEPAVEEEAGGWTGWEALPNQATAAEGGDNAAGSGEGRSEEPAPPGEESGEGARAEAEEEAEEEVDQEAVPEASGAVDCPSSGSTPVKPQVAVSLPVPHPYAGLVLSVRRDQAAVYRLPYCTSKHRMCLCTV